MLRLVLSRHCEKTPLIPCPADVKKQDLTPFFLTICTKQNALTGLVIIDIQNDYFPGGKMALENTKEASANAAALLSTFRRLQLPVIHIQHIATRVGATFFVPDTEGVEIHASVAPLGNETVIRKN